MGMTKANIECAFTRRQFNPCGKEIVGLPIDHLSAPCRSKRPDRAAMGNDVVLGWFSMPAPFARNQERDFMKNFLSAAALVATCCVALPGAANAISVLDAASLPRIQSGAVERIDWRPFRHCHGRRWDCHGGKFFRGDRDRRGKWDRGGRRDDDRRRGNHGGDRDND
jgi:hypothetical protein